MVWLPSCASGRAQPWHTGAGAASGTGGALKRWRGLGGLMHMSNLPRRAWLRVGYLSGPPGPYCHFWSSGDPHADPLPCSRLDPAPDRAAVRLPGHRGACARGVAARPRIHPGWAGCMDQRRADAHRGPARAGGADRRLDLRVLELLPLLPLAALGGGAVWPSGTGGDRDSQPGVRA